MSIWLHAGSSALAATQGHAAITQSLPTAKGHSGPFLAPASRSNIIPPFVWLRFVIDSNQMLLRCMAMKVLRSSSRGAGSVAV